MTTETKTTIDILRSHGFLYSHLCGKCKNRYNVFLNPKHYYHEVKLKTNGSYYKIYYSNKQISFGNPQISLDGELALIEAEPIEMQPA